MAAASLVCDAASAARSASGGPARRVVTGASGRCASGPAASPGAATWPRRRSASADIGKILLDQQYKSEHRRLRILAFRAEMDQRVVRRLRRHDLDDARSEERRVGKECRFGWEEDDAK